MYVRRPHVFMDQEGEAAPGGGSPAGAPAGGDPAGAGAGGGDPAASGGGAGGNVLAAGNAAPASPAGVVPSTPVPADPHAWAPEKHRVFGEDGKSLDVEATARKVAESYAALEKRLGSGDAPPASVDGYKINVPEALAEKIKADDLVQSADFKSFLGKMHNAKLNQEQLDIVAAELLERGVKMRETNVVLDAAETEAKLRALDGWKSDAEYTKNVRAAYQAGKAYAGDDFDSILKDYGNDARIVRLLANVGAEMAEDTQPSPEAQAVLQESLNTLMSSPAYLNANDPQHAATVQKVTALQAKVVGDKPVERGRSMSFKTG